jgi:hypothetical protein
MSINVRKNHDSTRKRQLIDDLMVYDEIFLIIETLIKNQANEKPTHKTLLGHSAVFLLPPYNGSPLSQKCGGALASRVKKNRLNSLPT